MNANFKDKTGEEIAASWSPSLERMLACIGAIRAVDAGLPVTWIEAILCVGKYQDHRNEGLSIKDLSDLMGISYSTMAEVIKKLGKPSHRFSAAADIIEIYPDLMDERRKLLKLSAKGKSLVQRIEMLNSQGRA